jgi:hypothetical protein
MVRLQLLGKLKKSTSSWTRTGDLPACSTVPQPATLPRGRIRYVGKWDLCTQALSGTTWTYDVPIGKVLHFIRSVRLTKG